MSYETVEKVCSADGCRTKFSHLQKRGRPPVYCAVHRTRRTAKKAVKAASKSMSVRRAK